jgi:hypothetical protein
LLSSSEAPRIALQSLVEEIAMQASTTQVRIYYISSLRGEISIVFAVRYLKESTALHYN